MKASTKTINEKDAKKAVRQLATKPAETVFPEPLAPEMSFNDFVKADLRVAQVVAAEVVEGSDKLLRLTLDIGEAKPRNVFAGIRSSYAPEDLLGLFFQLLSLCCSYAPKALQRHSRRGQGRSRA